MGTENGDRHHLIAESVVWWYVLLMPRVARVDVGDNIYHVLNRAVGRMRIFNSDREYQEFENLLIEASQRFGMRILSYTLMPNHWHLQLYPKNDKDLGLFMHWLTNAHTRRVHTRTQTIGTGPLYQGRYKSFLIQTNLYLLTVLKYIERNPVRAGLVARAEDWRWGSAWLRAHGTEKQKELLSELPIPLPKNYLTWINTAVPVEELKSIRQSVNKGSPFGDLGWVDKMIKSHNLESTTKNVGRPKNIRPQ